MSLQILGPFKDAQSGGCRLCPTGCGSQRYLEREINMFLTYTYEVRVYRKDSPPGSPPVVLTGSVVNAVN